MSQFAAVVQLDRLNGANGFRVSGVGRYDYSGATAASAGDINGDGFDDLVVGSRSGSYVVFGKAGAFGEQLDLATLDGADGFHLSGLPADNNISSVASAGDVNGDGIDDLIIGTAWAHPHDQWSGKSFIVFGDAAGFDKSLDLESLDGTNGFTIDGQAYYDEFGRSVAGAGDINGDGIDDLVIGAPTAGPVYWGSGEVDVVFGTTAGFSSTLDPTTLNGDNGFRIIGQPDEVLGQSVASAGDINNDGIDDFVIGAPNNNRGNGAAYVVFGRSSYEATVDLTALDGSNGFKVTNANYWFHGGYSVAPAGDINGDGFADVIMGVQFTYPWSRSIGSAFVVFGKASGFDATIAQSSLYGTNGFRIYGDSWADGFGMSVASAGDVNGDGFDDMIVGAPWTDPNGDSSGSSYVIFGHAGPYGPGISGTSLDGADGFVITGAAVGDRSGSTVASAGDINGDGLADLVVTAPDADPTGDSSGASYVIFGQLPDASVHRVGTVASQNLVGGDFNDILRGKRGDDHLYGHGGVDRMSGGGGADTIIGGGGADVMTGGHGADHFVFTETTESSVGAPDIIVDLTAGDVIDLSAIDANTHKSGDQAFHLVAAFTDRAGEMTLSYDAASNTTLLSLDVDKDGQADAVIDIRGDQHGFTGFIL